MTELEKEKQLTNKQLAASKSVEAGLHKMIEQLEYKVKSLTTRAKPDYIDKLETQVNFLRSKKRESHALLESVNSKNFT